MPSDRQLIDEWLETHEPTRCPPAYCAPVACLWEVDRLVPERGFGPHLDNADRARAVGGGRNKVTLLEVADIRERVARGHSDRRIADDFNVTPMAIRRIRLGATWRSFQ